MENEFYNRIVYRKNAFLELKEYLSQNFNGKKVLLISTQIKLLAQILHQMDSTILLMN